MNKKILSLSILALTFISQNSFANDFDEKIHVKAMGLFSTGGGDNAMGAGINSALILGSGLTIDASYLITYFNPMSSVFTFGPGYTVQKDALSLRPKIFLGVGSVDFSIGAGVEIDYEVADNLTVGIGTQFVKSFEDNASTLFVQSLGLGLLF